jgi:type II secretory ATPase GspE/PulE/Tfp pilus assembly ATPase PilB-like protein
VGIFELLKIDDPIQTLIRDGASPNSLKETARRKGMVPLRESGFLVALRGVTSLEEVDTVTRTERE